LARERLPFLAKKRKLFSALRVEHSRGHYANELTTANSTLGLRRATVETLQGGPSACRVEFKPITLRRPNSAGKSTISGHAVHARAVKRQNADADRTIGGGDSVILGHSPTSFAQHVTRATLTVRIDFSLGDAVTSTYGRITVDEADSSDLRKDIADKGTATF
jgi:hypothetical protein